MLELIINEDKYKKRIMLIENGVLIEQHEEQHEQKRLEGNIYKGIVQNVLPGMQSAFIDVGENKNTFIKLKDLLPKVDESIENIDEIIKNTNIKNVIKQGDKILIQVRRDGALNKGAKVSTHINLSGRFLVLMPNTDFITISQKIDNKEEIERLINDVKSIMPKGFGAIIRTVAVGVEKEKLKMDLDNLIAKWKEIELQYEKSNSNSPQLLYDNKALLRRTIMDIIDRGLNRILLNDKTNYKIVKNILEEFGQTKIEIELKEGKNLLDLYDISKQIEKMQERKIWLKCGGFITIDRTEALTAIDVNSAKYTGNKNVQDTILKVNKEATIEIAKQLRLRDIGGIIIIDYIDMPDNRQEEILSLLEENLKKDRTKTQVMGFTKLNLVEMTRKKLCNTEEY
ncbi:MAG: Rne/Rng family ribonuclease [Clostridiales bacterium]|nr:Rne/Rng family ribonuclease [Clostridiales bacterium]